MQAQIRLGRIFGVKIGLHYSWFFIAMLITLSLTNYFQTTNPDWGQGIIWSLAILTSVFFFVALLAHELSHAAVARSRGLPVHSITLFALGGVAQIKKEASDPKTEFWMGIVGPIASAAIGLSCLALSWALGWAPMSRPTTPLLAMLVSLGYINLGLALFNMIPGFPLDGGRVLLAVVWWATGNADRARRIAARVGQVVAALFIAMGLVRFFGGAGFGGLWIAFIGWFLLEASRASYAAVEVVATLRNLRVGDVLSRDCSVVDGHLNLQSFVDEHLLATGRRCFIVEVNGRMAGLVTPRDVRAVERPRWPSTTVRDAMRPLEELRTVKPETPLSEALETMQNEDLNQLPVVANGHLEGILTRGSILRVLQTRAELNI